MDLIERTDLLQRVAEGAPRLLHIVAPAGYGKTVFARQLAERLPGNATLLDCSGVSHRQDLMQRILRALAEEDAQRADTLSQTAIALSSGYLSDEDVLAQVREAWAVCRAPATLHVDNAEELFNACGAIDVLCGLASGLPRLRKMIVCTRKALPIRASRTLPPDEIMVMGADDLRFSEVEVRELMAGCARVDFWRDVFDVSQGWPMGVAFFAARKGWANVDKMLRKLNSVEFGQVYEYLIESVFTGLPAEKQAVLSACAVIPKASVSEVQAATQNHHAERIVAELATTVPFISFADDGTIDAHPFFRAAVQRLQGEKSEDYIRAAAAFALTAGDRYRSAELFLLLADYDNALDAIDGLEVYWRNPTPRLASIVSKVPLESLMHYPLTWSTAQFLRAYSLSPQEWAQQARAVLASLNANAPSVVVASVSSSLINALENQGRLDEADEELKALEARLGEGEFDAPARAIVDLWRAGIGVLRGEVDAAEPGMLKALASAAGNDIVEGVVLREGPGRIARTRGDRDAEKRALDEALEKALRSKNSVLIGVCVVDEAFGAWLRGDDAAFEAYVTLLEEHVDPTIEKGVRHFIECTRGRAAHAVPGYEQVVTRSWGYMIAAANAESQFDRERFSESAVAAADESHQGLYQILARVVKAEVRGLAAPRLADECRLLAEQVESVPLRRAVNAWAKGDHDVGMLGTLVKRFRLRKPERIVERPRLEILRRRVLVHSISVQLSPKEFALLALVALAQPISAAQIVDALWPDSEEQHGATTLRVTLSRLRSHFHGVESIVATETGYRLHSLWTCDMQDIESAMRRLRQEAGNLQARCDDAAFVVEALSVPPAPEIATQEWFAPTHARLDSYFSFAACALARSALEAGDANTALQYAQRVIDRDPLDEPAQEIAILAHLRRGEEAAAYRQYRTYRTNLKRELDAVPSQRLTLLLASNDPQIVGPHPAKSPVGASRR